MKLNLYLYRFHTSFVMFCKLWKHFRLFSNIQKILQEKKNKINDLKCWKNKNISSSRWISEEIWWQAEVFKNKAWRNEKMSESYIILIKMKSHLWFEISSTTTCIDRRLRKASQIRRIKKKISSRTVIRCIRSINRLMSTNWVKFRRR